MNNQGRICPHGVTMGIYLKFIRAMNARSMFMLAESRYVTHLLAHSLTHLLTHSLIHSRTHSDIHSLMPYHSVNHSLTHSLTYSDKHAPWLPRWQRESAPQHPQRPGRAAQNPSEWTSAHTPLPVYPHTIAQALAHHWPMHLHTRQTSHTPSPMHPYTIS